MRRLYVTGSRGFVGRQLRAALEAESAARWQLLDPDREVDLGDAGAMADAIVRLRPDGVIHLAAQAFVPESFRDPEGTIDTNVLGTLHLLRALSAAGFSGRMLYVGTGDVYGHVPPEELPISETRLPRPRNPYAVSKLAAEALCWQWHVSQGLDVVLARPFNHIGPGQSQHYAISDFARQIAEIRLGTRDPLIEVGDLDVTRDFTDVRDVVAAYLALLDRGTPGEIYNVCSGEERSLRSMLDLLLEVAGAQVTVQPRTERLRAAEQRRVCGDPAKIRTTVGWRPRIPLRDSLEAVLNDWEHKLAHG